MHKERSQRLQTEQAAPLAGLGDIEIFKLVTRLLRTSSNWSNCRVSLIRREKSRRRESRASAAGLHSKERQAQPPEPKHIKHMDDVCVCVCVCVCVSVWVPLDKLRHVTSSVCLCVTRVRLTVSLHFFLALKEKVRLHPLSFWYKWGGEEKHTLACLYFFKTNHNPLGEVLRCPGCSDGALAK